MNLPSTDAKLAATKENAMRSVAVILKRMNDDPMRTMKSIYAEASVEFDVSVRMLEIRMKRFRDGGWDALIPSHGGKSPGDDSLLSAEMEKRVQDIILDRTPDQLKMPFALWTRGAVQQLISQEFCLDLSIACVGNVPVQAPPSCLTPEFVAPYVSGADRS